LSEKEEKVFSDVSTRFFGRSRLPETRLTGDEV
jgi:hypothetical protein